MLSFLCSAGTNQFCGVRLHDVLKLSLQEFADVVFETKATLAEYHRREGDPNAVISAWKDDKRIITFAVPLSGVPDVVKTAIGEGSSL